MNDEAGQDNPDLDVGEELEAERAEREANDASNVGPFDASAGAQKPRSEVLDTGARLTRLTPFGTFVAVFGGSLLLYGGIWFYFNATKVKKHFKG